MANGQPNLNELFSALNIPPQAAAVVGAAFYFWPYVRSAWVQFHGGPKEVRDVRATLELLKLRCEIEALRRAHNLTEEQFTPPEIPLVAPQTPAAVAQTPAAVAHPLPRVPISKRERFYYGAGGAGIVVLGAAIWFSHGGTWDKWHFDMFIIAIALGFPLILMAGVVAGWVGIYNRWHAMAAGFVFPLALAGLMTWASNSP